MLSSASSSSASAPRNDSSGNSSSAAVVSVAELLKSLDTQAKVFLHMAARNSGAADEDAAVTASGFALHLRDVYAQVDANLQLTRQFSAARAELLQEQSKAITVTASTTTSAAAAGSAGTSAAAAASADDCDMMDVDDDCIEVAAPSYNSSKSLAEVEKEYTTALEPYRLELLPLIQKSGRSSEVLIAGANTSGPTGMLCTIADLVS
jgi:electron transfer flavoprotein alpha subunit